MMYKQKLMKKIQRFQTYINTFNLSLTKQTLIASEKKIFYVTLNIRRDMFIRKTE